MHARIIRKHMSAEVETREFAEILNFMVTQQNDGWGFGVVNSASSNQSNVDTCSLRKGLSSKRLRALISESVNALDGTANEPAPHAASPELPQLRKAGPAVIVHRHRRTCRSVQDPLSPHRAPNGRTNWKHQLGAPTGRNARCSACVCRDFCPRTGIFRGGEDGTLQRAGLEKEVLARYLMQGSKIPMRLDTIRTAAGVAQTGRRRQDFELIEEPASLTAVRTPPAGPFWTSWRRRSEPDFEAFPTG